MAKHLIVFLLITYAQGYAQDILLCKEASLILTLREMEVWVDSSASATLESAKNKLYRQISDYNNRLYLLSAAYWIKISLEICPENSKIWFLEFYDQTIDSIQIFGYDETQITFGDHYPFEHRPLRHKNFVLPLKDKPIQLWIRVRSNSFADIRIALRQAEVFLPYALNEYFLYGIFYGVILIICIYNFLTYIAIKDKKYVFYIFYILSVAFYALSLDGIGFQYLWPEYPALNKKAISISQSLVIIFSLVFGGQFLCIAVRLPQYNWIFRSQLAIRGVLAMSVLFGFDFWFTKYLDLVVIISIFLAGVLIWRKGYRMARFFVLAQGILSLGFLVKLLVGLSIIPFTIVSHYSLHFSFVLEMLFLTFALGDRIRILKDTKDRALRRLLKTKELINSELEAKVQARTLELATQAQELKAANERLYQQTQEMLQINSMLDLDNWKLKNSLKEIVEKQVEEQVLNYSQFRLLYSDENACYAYLEKLKWGEGYRCRKCGGEKYSTSVKNFARRCSKCGFNESVTAFTIFHGLKFDIVKAFYLSYLAAAGKDNRKLEDIANELEIRTNTVWAFRNKLKQRLQFIDKNQPHIWETLMLGKNLKQDLK